VKSLVLRFEPNPIEFTLPEALGPYPYVLEFSNLRLAARAGHLSGLGVGESPSMRVKLTNREGRVARMIGQPLRVLGMGGRRALFRGPRAKRRIRSPDRAKHRSVTA
jgi:hypothetical protein